jgi:carbonic anhydrase/acetyltransferase-like protein (isoleucine patch superfamily)
MAMSSDVQIASEPGQLWAKRMTRWRNYPQRFGKWWWWMWLTMHLSDLPLLGCFFTWLAGLPLGPYRQKWPLARITPKPYISPQAQISCSDLQMAPHCFIDDHVTIFSSPSGGSVILGLGVHIHRGTIVDVGYGGKVIVGEHTYIQPNCNLNAHLNNIRIGCEVMIAPDCGFFSYQHRVDDLSLPMCKQPLTSRGDIVIEDDVWIGTGAKIMDGVHIGRGAVIGAGAVVTKDIPAYSIAVGVPARVVSRRGAS